MEMEVAAHLITHAYLNLMQTEQFSNLLSVLMSPSKSSFRSDLILQSNRRSLTKSKIGRGRRKHGTYNGGKSDTWIQPQKGGPGD